MGMKRALTTAYHPQADGQTEIMNQTLEIFLPAYLGPNRDNWVSSLNGLLLSHNSTPHTATSFAPAYLLRGYVPVTGSSIIHSPQNISRYLEASYSLTEKIRYICTLPKCWNNLMLSDNKLRKHYYWDNIFRNELIIKAGCLMSLKKEI